MTDSATRSPAPGPAGALAPAATRRTAPSTLVVGVAAFGVYHLLLAVFMAVAPHAFYTDVGPFGVANAHYIRDVSTYNAALGVAFLLSVTRPSWRTPVLAVTTLQFALHSVNHLIDIGKAHPTWNGYFDFFSLLALTLLLGWLLRLAVRDGNSSRPAEHGVPR
jgi:hypothetical protein